MGTTFDRDLVRLLREAGCSFVRSAKGSHEIWFSPVTGKPVVVPNGIVSRHTANAILKQAGLPKAF
jgi:predicted RNA binding protein YcfA (HicA-like mRNA interferase family)